MTTPSITSQASSPTFEYLEHDMSMTREFYQMYMTADTVSNFVYGLLLAPLSLIAITEAVLKNGLFLMYNIVAFTLNTIIDVVTKVSEFVQSCFCDDTPGSSTSPFSSLTSYLGGITQPAQPVRIIPTAYDPNDVITFKCALREASSPESQIQVGVEHLFYNIWYDGTADVVCIQESHVPNPRTLKLKILDDGRFTSIRLDEVEQDQFPVDFDLCMWPCFDRAFEVSSSYVLERSHINIRTLRGSLLRIPAYHLEQFASQLTNAQGGVPSIRVQFLESNLRDNVGIDAGGPSRDWLDDLMRAVTQNSDHLCFVKREENLSMPVTLTPYQNGPLPTLSSIGRTMCRGIGQVMMFAHEAMGRDLMIGSIFEEALYAAAFSLTNAETNLRFDQLSEATRLKMAHAILRTRNSYIGVVNLLSYMLPQNQRYVIPPVILEGTPEFNIVEVAAPVDQMDLARQQVWRQAHELAKTSAEWVGFVDPATGNIQEFDPANAAHRFQVQQVLRRLQPQVWRQAHEWAKTSAGWTGFVDPATGNVQEFDPANAAHQLHVQGGIARLQHQMTPDDWEAAHAMVEMSDGWQVIENFDHANVDHQQRVQNGLRKMLWDEMGRNLDPIHAIAQGINLAKRRWNVDLSQVSPAQFCDKIQGTIDRQAVADALQISDGVRGEYRSEHLINQVGWLKEWILDERGTPPDHIATFVKFATGGSTLQPPPANRISVQVQIERPIVPMPKGHSCFGQIDLPHIICAGLDANGNVTRHNYGNATKEQFIHTMRGAILNNAGEYSMG